ncbi:hypothetical protein OH492_04035 [Vibrio chagasii]|nr:hypothetical protein [Vibrio chagasii]
MGWVFLVYSLSRLMHDVTQPITHMKNMVDRIRRGRGCPVEGKMHGGWTR